MKSDHIIRVSSKTGKSFRENVAFFAKILCLAKLSNFSQKLIYAKFNKTPRFIFSFLTRNRRTFFLAKSQVIFASFRKFSRKNVKIRYQVFKIRTKIYENFCIFRERFRSLETLHSIITIVVDHIFKRYLNNSIIQ